MTFLAPVWLLGLLPWAAVAGWVLSGRRERAAVPFLELWRGGERPVLRSRRGMERPPVAILLLLVASLLGIFAGARPHLLNAGGDPRDVIVVVDRGITMSAAGQRGSARWAELMETVEPLIGGRIANARFQYVFVPPTEGAPIDTNDQIVPAIQRALLEQDAIVVAITDRTLDLVDDRLIQLAPETQAKNVGIVHAALSESPRAQVLVRLRNDSTLSQSQVRVGSTTIPVDLPPGGQERNYFVDIETAGDSVSVEVVAEDDLPLDNRLELVRRSAWPRIEGRGLIAPELQRMIQTYQKLRPSAAGASNVLVSAESIEPMRSGVMIATGERAVSGPAIVESHPIGTHVNWDALTRQGVRVAAKPSGEWKAVVSVENTPLIAVREGSARQVWVGFDSDSFPRSSDYVIFWTNVFDWLGGAKGAFDIQGTPAIPMPVPPAIDTTRQLSRLPAELRSGREISLWPAAAAVGLIFLASLVWGVAKIAR